MSAMARLKEFTGPEKNEEQARNWISKVKTALLHNQETNEEKCMLVSDLLQGECVNGISSSAA